MDTVTYHFWMVSPEGKAHLYEITYEICRVREGVLRYIKVPHSERPCTCPDREACEQRLAAGLPVFR